MTVTSGSDDFALDGRGDAWVTSGTTDALIKIGIEDGSVEVVARESEKIRLIGPAACRFGRTKRDVERGTLYVVNNGGIAGPPPQGIIGGSIFVVDTAWVRWGLVTAYCRHEKIENIWPKACRLNVHYTVVGGRYLSVVGVA